MFLLIPDIPKFRLKQNENEKSRLNFKKVNNMISKAVYEKACIRRNKIYQSYIKGRLKERQNMKYLSFLSKKCFEKVIISTWKVGNIWQQKWGISLTKQMCFLMAYILYCIFYFVHIFVVHVFTPQIIIIIHKSELDFIS